MKITAQQRLQSAQAALSRGELSRAESLLSEILAIQPDHPDALFGLGVVAFRQGKHDAARWHLTAAQAVQPGNPAIGVSLAVVHRQFGDPSAELVALDASLAADPYFLPALLARGDVLVRLGRPRAAASTYANAVRAAGPEATWPAALRPALASARSAAAAHGRELAAFLADRMATKLSALTSAEAERWREAGAILSGQSRPYVSHCNRLHVPRLPAVPFFERDQFEWIDELEAQTETILAELVALLATERASFNPYIAYPPGTPVNQWGELNHSDRWGSFFLWRDGSPVSEAQQRCPSTTRALQQVDMAHIGGLCPNAMFSRLAPHTHIPPHQGETNARAVVHLPLIVPDGCSYRVGFEKRAWQVGTVLAFDDTLEHEARNDSDEERVVLIFDVWNPYLSRAEREMVQAVSAAAREFHMDS